MTHDENPQVYPLRCKVEGGRMILSDTNGELRTGCLEVSLAPGVASICFEISELADGDGRYELRGALRQKGGPKKPLKELPGGTLRSSEISVDSDAFVADWALEFEAQPLPGNAAKPPTTVVIETKIHGATAPKSYMTGS